MLKHFKKRGKIISICSNRDTGSLDIILTHHNLKSYFDNIISCHAVGKDKPDPFCLKELMEKYPDTDLSETVYFGDSKTDAEFATNAGIDYIIIDHYLNKKLFYQMILESFADSEDNSPLINK